MAEERQASFDIVIYLGRRLVTLHQLTREPAGIFGQVPIKFIDDTEISFDSGIENFAVSQPLITLQKERVAAQGSIDRTTGSIAMTLTKNTLEFAFEGLCSTKHPRF